MTALKVLQVNLCRSGKARGCWHEGGVGDPGSSLYALVEKVRDLQQEKDAQGRPETPDFITIDEGCSKDIGITSDVGNTVLHQLQEELGLTYQRAWQASGYTRSAGDPPAKYQCVRGPDDHTPERGTYGIGILSLTKTVGVKGDVTRGVYPTSAQQKDVSERNDGNGKYHVSELRPYMCAEYPAATACVTHLTVDQDEYDGAADVPAVQQEARRAQQAQCALLKERLAGAGDVRATVFGGDLNLSYPDADHDIDAQDCVPSGFTRKGDRSVQHIMASPRFDFESVSGGDLGGTDHPALLGRMSR